MSADTTKLGTSVPVSQVRKSRRTVAASRVRLTTNVKLYSPPRDVIIVGTAVQVREGTPLLDNY